MKKTYLTPKADVAELELENIICESIDILGDGNGDGKPNNGTYDPNEGSDANIRDTNGLFDWN